jgi:integrase
MPETRSSELNTPATSTVSGELGPSPATEESPALSAETYPGTITVNLATLDPSVANRIVGLLNRKEARPRRHVKVNPEIDLSTEEVRKMLDLAGKTGPEHYCLVGFMAIGLRESEVVGRDDPRTPIERRLPGLRVDDFRFQGGSVWVHGKGYTYLDEGSVKEDASKIVLYPVPPGLLEPAKVLAREVEGRIVPIPTRKVRRIVKRYAKLAGVEDWRLCHPHRLRHSFEDLCKPFTKNEMELSDMMRHSKSRFGTTGTYDRKIADQRRREVLLQATELLFA